VTESASSLLGAWTTFYATICSSAAALIGLMFVVITLVVNGRRGPSREGLSTFSTPTVVHFCAALLASVMLVAPWRTLVAPGLLTALLGAIGVAYVVRIAHRTRRQEAYKPDLEDWCWYAVMPLVTYAVVCAGGLLLLRASATGLVTLAAGIVMLVLTAIRNAWDVVTYLAVDRDEA
jgi:hypothetical protein